MGDGLFSKLKMLVGIEEVEDDYEEESEETMDWKPREVRSSYSQPKNENKEVKENRVVAMQNLTNSRVTNQFKMVVIEPKSFDESPKLVDNLKAKKPVIINLEKLDSDVARKIFDFLSGATYALNGNVEKVANNIFVFAPENVDVASSVDQKNVGYSDNLKNPWR